MVEGRGVTGLCSRSFARLLYGARWQGLERRQEGREEAISVTQVRGDGRLDQGTLSEVGERAWVWIYFEGRADGICWLIGCGVGKEERSQGSL